MKVTFLLTSLSKSSILSLVKFALIPTEHKVKPDVSDIRGCPRNTLLEGFHLSFHPLLSSVIIILQNCRNHHCPNILWTRKCHTIITIVYYGSATEPTWVKAMLSIFWCNLSPRMLVASLKTFQHQLQMISHLLWLGAALEPSLDHLLLPPDDDEEENEDTL